MRKARHRGIIASIFDKWPGKRIFGPYRLMPLFFFLGAALEFSMINWTVGETNFYRVYKINQVEKEARSIIEKEKFVQVNLNKV
ncbi:hypothetical protein CHS0354_038510 [Potamilus streckersoni]|uniref:Small integral membrane protein 4 n=1 Tax=Potamilus streckersoni TaxID=2493646 RepID=A0AAE0S5W5_9BIVA|nr:hypothetical protein CHS0354_038510 [Potamilus streckersoni]